MTLRTTRTVAQLQVSQATFDEILVKLHRAGYDHAFTVTDDKNGVVTVTAIDMHGIELTREP